MVNTLWLALLVFEFMCAEVTMKHKKVKAAKIERLRYESWLRELKAVLGGPIELTPNPNSNDDDNVILRAYTIGSAELPEDFAKDLMIWGYYDDIAGFKIFVTVDEYRWLLMGHQTHTPEPKGFTSVDGVRYGDHPHFHELDFGTPHKKNGLHRVTSQLRTGISSAELLNALMQYYSIEDGTSNVSLPTRTKTKIQMSLINVPDK